MLVCQQQQPCPLDFGERRGVADTELLQVRRLFRRESDCILGQRSWPGYSPPDSAKIGQAVVCQDFIHL